MKKSTLKLVQLPLLALVCAIIILGAIYPYRPEGTIGWVALFLIAIPVCFCLEFIGKGMLENEFVGRFGRVSRIFIGTVGVVLISILVLFVWSWIKPYLGTWR